MTGDPALQATADRLAGYYAAPAVAGLPILPALVREVHFSGEGGYEAARALLGLPRPPTAIFAHNDSLALGVLQAARGRGLDVPGRLSIVGFDDRQFASLITPALTTVRQPIAELGRVGVDMLFRLLDGHPIEASRVTVSTSLVVRDSTAPPPPAA